MAFFGTELQRGKLTISTENQAFLMKHILLIDSRELDLRALIFRFFRPEEAKRPQSALFSNKFLHQKSEKTSFP